MQINKINNQSRCVLYTPKKISYDNQLWKGSVYSLGLGLGYLTQLSTIFQLYQSVIFLLICIWGSGPL